MIQKIAVVLMFFRVALFAHEADIFVFSYDRPLQLYAFLESLDYHASHRGQTSVLYRCSAPEYRAAYEKVTSDFSHVKFIEQKNPPHDFKSILLDVVFRPESAEYVAFAVDDLIVTDKIDFNECIEAVQVANAYGFYLRLGQNIDDCWSSGHYEGIPPMTKMNDNIYAWVFKTGIGNWAYPNTVDMTIYRKQDIEAHFRAAPFFHPNSLEDHFGVVNLDLLGLCYETSRVVNIPMNIVSETADTRHLNVSVKELLDRFNAGLKIDITPLFQYRNRSAHVFTYEPIYLPR
jgi:hypothetical protein